MANVNELFDETSQHSLGQRATYLDMESVGYWGRSLLAGSQIEGGRSTVAKMYVAFTIVLLRQPE